jgi:uncharacterized membrane protein YhaH (DUF805 family)
MDFRFLYLDTRGRIGRKAWWLGTAGLIVISIIVGLVVSALGLILGLHGTTLGIGIMQLVTTVILFRPLYALSLKRLHDRNRPERLFWFFFAPSFLVTVLAMLGVSGTLVEVEMFGRSIQAFKANALGRIVSLAALGASLWAIYELGFRKSAKGAVSDRLAEGAPSL